MGYFKLPTLKGEMFKLNLPKSALIPAVFTSLLGALGEVLIGSTHLFLIEQYVCREYFTRIEFALVRGSERIDESLCKVPEIQSDVAGIYGTYAVLGFIPALFLTGPWGKLARILGKKTVLFINACSLVAQACYFVAICYFPGIFNIRWIWATPLFEVFGGGSVILSSLIYSYIAESVDPKQFSSVLYKFSAIQLLMAFLSMSLSSYILRINVWLLCLTAISVLVLILPAISLFPSASYISIQRNHERNPSLSTCGDPNETSSSESTSLISEELEVHPKRTVLNTILHTLMTNYRHSIELFKEIVTSSLLSRLTFLTFFLLTLTSGIRVVFTQWASTQHSWTIADVHVLSSFEMIVTAAILLLISPLSKRYLLPHLHTTSAVDMTLAKISLGFSFLGLLCMAVSPTRVTYIMSITLYTLGNSFKDSLRSFTTGLLGGKEEVERCYIGIGLVETLGGMTASALWMGTFSRVIGKMWWIERMPFWGALFMILVTALVVRRLGRFVGGSIVTV